MNDLAGRTYNICMETQIGRRYGYLTVLESKDHLKGYFEILKHGELFEGTIQEDGKCEFSGKIITLVQTLTYTAVGCITEDALVLMLECERLKFKVTGSPIERNKD